jgi:glucosamine--fructose-6-phosphate aminotransferase (isomerizing)
MTATTKTVSIPPNATEVLRTMRGQPDDIRRLLADGWKQARQAVDLLDGAERLILTGIGSSYYAAMFGAWLFRAIGVDARAVSAGDIWLYPQNHQFRPTDAVIVLSHYGLRSAAKETLNLARAAGSTVLSIGSLTVEHPGSRLILRTVERETSVVSTAAQLAAMTVLTQVALLLGERGRPASVAGWRSTLEELPGNVESLLARDAEIVPIARMVANRRIYAIAAGPNEPTVLEFMTKAQQAGHEAVDAVALEQLIHGPILAAGNNDVGILIRMPGASLERSGEYAKVMDRIGMRLWVIGEGVPGVHPVGLFEMPAIPEILSPLLTLIPVQLLAYHIALIRHIDPDAFSRLETLVP